MSVIPFTSVYYPESDGKPMGETDLHREEMFRLIHSLQRFYAGRKVYVSGNLLLYYEQGNPKKFVVPDVFARSYAAQDHEMTTRTTRPGKPPPARLRGSSRAGVPRSYFTSAIFTACLSSAEIMAASSTRWV